MKHTPARLLIAVLTFTVGVTTFAVWLFLRSPHANSPSLRQSAYVIDTQPTVATQAPPYSSKYENPAVPDGLFYVVRGSGEYLVDAADGYDERALVISYEDEPVERNSSVPDAPTLLGFYLSHTVRLNFERVEVIGKKVYFKAIGTERVSYEFSGITGEESIPDIDDSKPVPFIEGVLTRSRDGKTEREEEIKFRHVPVPR